MDLLDFDYTTKLFLAYRLKYSSFSSDKEAQRNGNILVYFLRKQFFHLNKQLQKQRYFHVSKVV
jgi:hypothetical protein